MYVKDLKIVLWLC